MTKRSLVIFGAIVFALCGVLGADVMAQGPGLPGLGLPGAMNGRPAMIGTGRPSVAAGGHGTPGQLNARTGGRGYSAHSFSQGSSSPARRSGGSGLGMAGVPQAGQFRANTQQFRGQNMARGMGGANIPNFGGRR